MLARGALQNMSIFRKEEEELDDLPAVITKYLHKAIDFNNYTLNTKYVLQQFLRYNSLLDSPKVIS